MARRPVDQLYLFLSTIEADPPASALSDDEITTQHLAFVQDLKDQGRLVGAGSARDKDGTRFMDGGEQSGGIIILRADGLAQAEALARDEPYCREGRRRIKVVPWQRTWFED